MVLTITILFSLLITFLYPVRDFSLAFAEDTPLQKADNDYAYQYSKYVEAHDKYITSKSTYLTFKTATAKNDAHQKTKDYLKQVHAVYVSYLLLTKEIGNSFDWGENSKNKNEIAKNLDSEISFFENNVIKIDTTQTLEESPPIAKDLESHITDITNILIKNTQITYRITETKTRIKQFSDLSVELDTYARDKLPKDKYDAFFPNWNSEVKKVINSAQTTLDATTNTLILRSYYVDEDIRNLTIKTQNILDILKQGSTLFAEVLRI